MDSIVISNTFCKPSCIKGIHFRGNLILRISRFFTKFNSREHFLNIFSVFKFPVDSVSLHLFIDQKNRSRKNQFLFKAVYSTYFDNNPLIRHLR